MRCLLCAVLTIASSALAIPISYTLEGRASGFIGGAKFSDVNLVFTIFADTNLIHPLGTIEVAGVQNNPAVATVTIDGIGTGTLLEEASIFVNYPAGIAGFGAGGRGDLFDLSGSPILSPHPVFTTYDLATPIGPISAIGFFPNHQFTNVPTSLGRMTITSSTTAGTFTASTVPEPSTMWLGLLAASAVAGGRRGRWLWRALVVGELGALGLRRRILVQ